MELSSADIDIFDPECIKVQHKPSGLNILIKKDFIGAELEDGEKLESSFYSIHEIDSEDVHFAVLRKCNSDSYIKAKRNFSGSKIVDVEMRSGVWLVGRTVKSENDFDFDNAFAINNGEDVVAVHKLTGLKFKIFKSFVGAVCENGEVLEEYLDTPIVDGQNVRLGFFNGNEYKRNFVGGLITAIFNQDQTYQSDSFKDNTAFFIQPPEMTFINETLESIKFNQEDFSNTFAEGFFSKLESKEQLPVSIEIQTDEPDKNLKKLDSCLSLTILDSISISPYKLMIKTQEPIFTYEEPAENNAKEPKISESPIIKFETHVKKFQKFENIIEENSFSSRSSTVKRKKKPKKKKFSSKNSSKISTPRNSSLYRNLNSGSLKSQESNKSIEEIYLQRLNLPKEKIKKFSNVHAYESDSDLSLSIQMSLNRLNMISAPTQHNFELLRKKDSYD